MEYIYIMFNRRFQKRGWVGLAVDGEVCTRYNLHHLQTRLPIRAVCDSASGQRAAGIYVLDGLDGRRATGPLSAGIDTENAGLWSDLHARATEKLATLTSRT